MTRRLIAFGIAVVWVVGWVCVAEGQSLSERINNARQSMSNRAAADPAAQALQLNRRKMAQQLPTVTLEDIAARDAVTWLENVADLKVLVNWDRMLQEEGISGDTNVAVVGRNLTAEAALDMILKQVTIDSPLMWEVTPWYVRVITKAQADANPVLRVYPIGDLLINVPNFTNAPDFDLQSISQSGAGGGGGGGGGGQSLFDDEDEDEDEEETRANRAEEIANLIRESVQPDIWRANGGLHSAITVYQERSGLRPVYRGPAPSGVRAPRPTFRERRKSDPDALYRFKTQSGR
ncbi:MAG: hypothetical protein ACYTGQ_19680 [Planctomycetota bacterium]|jgi:hypothetical protein